MNSALQLDNILLKYLDSNTIDSGLSKTVLLDIQKRIICFLKQMPELNAIRQKLFNLLFKLKHSAKELDILDEHDNYFESMNILLNYYMELEILALNDPGCDENNLDVFNRIFIYLNYFLNHSELNIVKTFVHYFIRDNNIKDLKDDPILKELFCQLFEKLFLTTYQKNRPKGNELDFFSYLFIFKLWHYVCSSIEEKHEIEQLIPLLYKFDTDLISFVISKKYVTHTYYEHGLNTLNNIKERIMKMLKTEECSNESLPKIENLTNTPYFDTSCTFTTQIPWLDKLTKGSDNILVESSDEDISSHNSQPIVPRISDVTTIRVDSLETVRNKSEISTIYVSSNHSSKNNISSVSTVRLDYSENDDDDDDDEPQDITEILNSDNLAMECPSNSIFFTAPYSERVASSNSHSSNTYVSCLSHNKTKNASSSQQNDGTSKTINPESFSCSPRLQNLPKISNRKSHIRIIERKDYIKRTNSRKRTFSMFRDERLVSKQSAVKRKNSILENGWTEIKKCSVKLKRLDNLEIEALKNKKLPIEFFSRTYSNKSSDDEQKSESSIELNDSNISIEILEETLGSRAYLYCREVQKTLKKETKKFRKRAKSCYTYNSR